MGQDKLLVPANASMLLGFDCTNNAAITGDPSLTLALITTPTAAGFKDVLWTTLFFHPPPGGIPVTPGQTLYVVTSGAATWFAQFDEVLLS